MTPLLPPFRRLAFCVSVLSGYGGRWLAVVERISLGRLRPRQSWPDPTTWPAEFVKGAADLIHYVVVAGRPDVIAPLAPRLSRAVDATAYFEGERCENTASGRPWMMAANLLPDLFSESRVASDRDSLILFNGEALAASGEQASMPDALLRIFGSAGSQGVVDALDGSYNFVGVDPAVGLRAFPDFSGLSPVYWSSTEDYVVVSNRSTTVAHITGSTDWSLRSLAWVIGHGNLFGVHMPASGVSCVPPGQQLEVDWGTATARVTAAPTWSWPEPGSDEGRPNLSPDEWDEVVESLVANFAAVQHLLGDLTLRLTGGKDSRLCLAIAKAAGLEKSIHTFTTGPPDSQEVVTAKIVAKVAGFDHRRPYRRPRPDAMPREAAELSASPVLAPATAAATNQEVPQPHAPDRSADTDRIWDRLRRDAYRYDGVINAWSGLGTSPKQALDVMGWGGELFRRGHTKQFRNPRLVSVDQLAQRFINYHQPHDPLGVLQPDEAEYQQDWMQRWVRETAETVRLDFVPEKFYVEHRLGHWSGPLLQFAPLRMVINPLLNAFAARKMLELSTAARCSERFHFEVMRRAAPELVPIPFLNDAWDPAMMPPDEARRAEESPLASRATAPARPPTPLTRARAAGAAVLNRLSPASRSSRRTPTSTPQGPPTSAPQRPLKSPPRRRPPTRNPGQLLIAQDKEGIEALFRRAARGTDMGQICDMDRLIDITRKADDLQSVEVRELFGCIGAAITLLGDSQQVLDRPR